MTDCNFTVPRPEESQPLTRDKAWDLAADACIRAGVWDGVFPSDDQDWDASDYGRADAVDVIFALSRKLERTKTTDADLLADLMLRRWVRHAETGQLPGDPVVYFGGPSQGSIDTPWVDYSCEVPLIVKIGHAVDSAPALPAVSGTVPQAESKRKAKRPSLMRVVPLRSDRECSLGHHCRGALREIVSLAEKLASKDPERFIYARLGFFVKHARRFSDKRPYSRSAIVKGMNLACEVGILRRSERHGRAGYVVEQHRGVRAHGQCSLHGIAGNRVATKKQKVTQNGEKVTPKVTRNGGESYAPLQAQDACNQFFTKIEDAMRPFLTVGTVFNRGIKTNTCALPRTFAHA